MIDGPDDPQDARPTEPDWAALADRHQSETLRRRRLTVLGSVTGMVVIAALVTAAVMVSGNGSKDQRAGGDGGASDSPGGSAGPSGAVATGVASAAASRSATASVSASASAFPSASASAYGGASKQPVAKSSATGSRSVSPDPLTVISDVSTDTASLSAGGLFAARTLTIDGRTWTRTLTASTSPCWKATTGGLGDVLAVSDCHSLLRATYVSGDSAVTVGVAVMDHKSQADTAERNHKGQIQGLTAAGAVSFCTSPTCVNTHASLGRYGYFTVSGSAKSGGTTTDAAASAAGPDLAAYAHDRLLARGKPGK